MKLEKFTVSACCGKKSVIYKIDRPITTDLLKKIVAQGFNELEHFTKAGILYVDNLDFILTGPIGSNRLQVKCRKEDCDSKIESLEALLKQLE